MQQTHEQKRQDRPRRRLRAEARGAIADNVVAALLPPIGAVDVSALEGRRRVEIAQDFARKVGAAIWRAEKRGRRVSADVRRSASWVQGQRRQIALDVIRWLRSIGAGVALSNQLAERAALRFPRDGIIIAGPPHRLRDHGTAPRQVGESPRQRGTNPRARGESPRQRRRRLEREDVPQLEQLVEIPTTTELPPPAPAEPEGPRVDPATIPEWRALKEELRRDRVRRAITDEDPPT